MARTAGMGHNPFDLAHWWRGEGRLAPLYWGWGVAGSLVLALLVAGPPLAGRAGLAWGLVGVGIGALYTAWLLVSIWRCAGNIAHPAPLGVAREAWTWLSRWLTVAWAINAAATAALLLQGLVIGRLGG